MKTIKAEIWELKICEGVMGYIHGQYYTLVECYIPEYKISFNADNGMALHVFSTPSSRYDATDLKPERSPKKTKDIDLPLDFAKDLKNYVDSKERLLKEAQKYLKK